MVSIDLSRKHTAVENHSEGRKPVVPVDDKLVPPQEKVVVISTRLEEAARRTCLHRGHQAQSSSPSGDGMGKIPSIWFWTLPLLFVASVLICSQASCSSTITLALAMEDCRQIVFEVLRHVDDGLEMLVRDSDEIL